MESQKQDRRVKEMKRLTKIIALASIFSFIISYSSLIFSLQQRLQYSLSMYSNLVDKKFMFLLCNGIVGLILGSFRGNSETHLHGKATYIVEQTKHVRIKEMRETQVSKALALLEDKKSTSKEEEGEKEEKRIALLRGGIEEVSKEQEQKRDALLRERREDVCNEQEQKRVALLRERREEVSKEQEQKRDALLRERREEVFKEQEQKRVALLRERREEVSKEEEEERVAGGKEENALVIKDEEANLVQDIDIFRIVDHDDGETDDSSSSEDINKKCEEFIRKMKANIRLESRKMITL